MSKFIPRVITGENVTVYLDGLPNSVAKGTIQYDLVLAALELGDEAAVRQAIDVKQAVVAKSFGNITIEANGDLHFDGRPLRGTLVDRILSVIKNAGDAGPLISFLNNLMQNPSKRAVDELYGFLEACDLPITSDGYFLAYKKVNSDFTSIHDGKTDNSIGSNPSVPRNSVDEDKDRTCSSGLHFCSKSYLPHFGSYGGNKVLVLKINPADVVAIPSDYNNAKGRAWTYEVVAELKDGEEIAAGFEGKYDLKPVAKTASKSPAPLASTATKVAPVKVPATPASTVGVGSLTDAQVREIRNLLSDNWPLASIAKGIGTSARTVARIRDGETYTHVK